MSNFNYFHDNFYYFSYFVEYPVRIIFILFLKLQYILLEEETRLIYT